MNHKFPYKSILIACSVNTARSRMVEGYLKHFFAKKNQDIEVYSCGVASNARDGMLISMDAKLAMKEIGIELSDEALSKDLKKHRSAISRALHAMVLDGLVTIDDNWNWIITIYGMETIDDMKHGLEQAIKLLENRYQRTSKLLRNIDDSNL